MSEMLEEFEIHALSKPFMTIGDHPIAFTNSALFMFLAVLCSTALMVLAMKRRALVPGRWQMLAETLYNLVTNMLESSAGEKAKPFFPLIFTIFVFLLFSNLLGMLPWSLSVTSHVLVNLMIALILFTVIIVTGFAKHGLHFLGIFVPRGAPGFMLPFLIVLEFFSFAVRPLSLSIRLFANMLAGHILLAVFAGMGASLAATGWAMGVGIGFLPLVVNVAITAFEFFVAFLQAYIYAILASIYLRDALETH
ncbi:MAG: F0F1 ATP synthase subunit A [Bdellovibrionales bacterium]